MPRRLAALAALSLLVAATGASAAEPSLVQSYKALCYDTHADTKTALAKAAAAGWRAPDQPPPGAPPGLTFRTRKLGAKRLDLMVGEQETPAGQQFPFATKLRVCIVAASPGRIAVHKAMRDLVGVEPLSRKGGTWGWGYSEAAGKRDFKTPASQEEASARASAGSMVILDARETDQGSALGFTRISKAGK
jgi:hypothetical protein